ncbi:hypothetical protein [Candidatus Orientia mediorientalis]|nr:hypothetical protein [Candidatus Orientia mediorientalis]
MPLKNELQQKFLLIKCHNSDAYQYERAERLGVSKSGIQKALKRLNI